MFYSEPPPAADRRSRYPFKSNLKCLSWLNISGERRRMMKAKGWNMYSVVSPLVSDLTSHQSRSAAAGSGVVFHTGVLQTRLALLPQSLHGLVTNLLLLLQLGLHLLSCTHRFLYIKTSNFILAPSLVIIISSFCVKCENRQFRVNSLRKYVLICSTDRFKWKKRTLSRC